MRDQQAGQQQAPAGGAVRRQQQVQRVTKQAPAGGRPAARQAKSVPPPTFQFPDDAVKACLLFYPPDIYADMGQEFEVSVVLHNRSNIAADALSFTVLYDTQRVELQGSDTTPLGAYLGDAPEQLHVVKSPGQVNVKADLKKPLNQEQAVLATLRFVVKEVAGTSAIRFLRPPRGLSGVFSRGDNILGDASQGLTGLIDAHIFVLPVEAMRPVVLDSDSLSSAPLDMQEFLQRATPYDTESTRTQELRGWLHTPPAARREAETWLALQGPANPVVKVGSSFWVDLVLINDSLMPIDSLGLTLAFDPDALEVLDEDEGNWIFRGVNAWDGAFHEAYPFDFHRSNEADNAAGRLVYQLARHAGAWDFPSGVFARVHFRAKAPVAQTEVRILRDGMDGPDRWSWLRAYGLDHLDRSYAGRRPPSLSFRIEP